MGTYFGYVKREADSYINWADIGKQMVDGLDKIEKDREEKRKAFEQDTRDKYNFVADNPMGESQSVNEFSLKLANDAQNYMLQLNKLVKSGKMKMNDYLIRSQNLKDDTQTMYKMMKAYQDRAKVVSERMQKNQSQPIEWQTFEQMEGFANFAKTYAHIDANSGRLWSAEKEKKVVDGKEIYTIPSTPSGKLQPMQMLAATMNMNYDKYDVNGNLTKMVGSFGKEINVIEDIRAKVGKHGRISEVLDIRKRKGLMPGVKSDIEAFEQAETKMIESQLTNQFNTTSILMSDMRPQGGGQYGITYDLEEAKRDPSKIYMKVVNNKLQPDFESTENGRKQYNDVVEHMRTRMRLMYDHVEKPTVTPAEEDVATDRAYKLGMLEVARQNARTAAKNAATSAKKASEDDVPIVGKDKKINTQALEKKIRGLNWNTIYVEDKPQETKTNLIDALNKISSGLGFSVEGKGVFDDKIIVKSPNANVPERAFSIDEPNDYEGIIQYFINPDNYNAATVPQEFILNSK